MKNIKNARAVTLGDLKDEFFSHIWTIIVVAILCVSLFLAYTTLTFEPKYESKATLYILKQDGNSYGGDGYSTSSDFSLALNVVNDCTYLLKSHKVLDDVLTQLDLDMSYEELARSISTSNPDGTRVLEVKVRTDAPEKARQIVNCVCQVGAEAITEAMGFKQVNLYEYGTFNEEPCNRTGYKTYAFIGIGAALLTYAVVLLKFLLDDRIRSEEDVHDYLNLSVLGEIPNSSEKSGGRYGYQSRSKNKNKYVGQHVKE